MAETDLDILRMRAAAAQAQLRLRLSAQPQTVQPQAAQAQSPANDGYVDPNTPLSMWATPTNPDVTNVTIGEGAGDVAKSLASGIVRGATGLADMANAVTNPVNMARNTVNAARTAWETRDPRQVIAAGMGEPMVRNAVDAVTGGATQYDPQTTAGEYAKTIGDFVAGAAALPGGMVRNVARFAVLPGVASETAGQATEGTPYEPYARAAAAILAPLSVSGVAKVISPNGGADPQRLALAATLDSAGVPVTAGQRVGNTALQRRELMTGPGQQIAQGQTEEFTRAVLQTLGTDARRATPEVMEQTSQRIGQVFNEVTRGVAIQPTRAMVDGLKTVVDDYAEMSALSEQAPAVSAIYRQVNTAQAMGQPLTGERIQSWRSQLSRLTRSANGPTRDAAIEALDIIDESMAAELTALGRTDDVARLAMARDQYRSFLAVEAAISRAGQDATVGLLSPAALRSAVALQGRRAYTQGNRGQLGELARAGAGILTRPNSSGTAENLAAMGVPSNLAGMAGATVGGVTFGPTGAVIGGIAGGMAPSALRRLQMTSPMQNWLANQLMSAPRAGVNPNVLLPLAGSPTTSGQLPR